MTAPPRRQRTAVMALIVLAAVMAAGSRVTISSAPRAVPAGGVHASAPSPIFFVNATPWNGQWISSKTPVIVVLYADVAPGAAIAAATFVLDGLSFNTTGLFNNTLFHLLVPFELSNGPHAAQLTLRDSFGSTNTTAWSFTVFAVPPILVVTQPAYTFVPVPGVLVEGTAVPPVPYPQVLPLSVTVAPRPGSVTLPVALAANGSFRLLTPLVPGVNTLFVNATDAIGNTATVVKAVVCDLVPPVLTVTTPANLTRSNRSVIPVAGTAEFGSYLTVNGVSVLVNPNGTWSMDLALPDGIDLVKVVDADLAGNVAFVVRVVLVDTQAPTVVLTSPLSPITNRSRVVVSGIATDPNLVAVLVNNEAATLDAATGAFSKTLTLPDGTWPIVVVAVDYALNHGVMTAGILVDTTPPVVKVTGPPNGLETNRSTVLVTGTVDDANATILVGGAQVRPAADKTWKVAVPLMDGANVISVSAVDLAGNHAATVTRTVTYDAPFPEEERRIAQAEHDLAVWTGTVTLSLLAVLLVFLVALSVVFLRMDRRLVELRGTRRLTVVSRKPAPPKAASKEPPKGPANTPGKEPPKGSPPA